MSEVTPRVLVFFDYACQFCYLDWPRFKRLRHDAGAELVLMPYELRPTLPGSVPVADIGGGHSPRVEEYMRRLAEEASLPLVLARFVPNTHWALALAEFARDVGPEAHEAIHEAVFSAYSGRGEDIGELDVLLRIADEHALDPEQVREALESGRYDERLEQFTRLALSFGVTATPAALVCNTLFIGTRPYEVLRRELEQCLVDEHNVAAHIGEALA